MIFVIVSLSQWGMYPTLNSKTNYDGLCFTTTFPTQMPQTNVSQWLIKAKYTLRLTGHCHKRPPTMQAPSEFNNSCCIMALYNLKAIFLYIYKSHNFSKLILIVFFFSL